MDDLSFATSRTRALKKRANRAVEVVLKVLRVEVINFISELLEIKNT
jgi:hypothetical protein